MGITELQTLLREHVAAVRLAVDELRNVITQPPLFTDLFGPAVVIGDGERTLVITAGHVFYGAPAVTVEGLNLDVVDPDDECIKPFVPIVGIMAQLAQIVAQTPYNDRTHVTLYHKLEARVWNTDTGNTLALRGIYPHRPPMLTWLRQHQHDGCRDDAADAVNALPDDPDTPDDVGDDTPMPRDYWRGYETGWDDGAYQRPKQSFPSRLYRRGYHRGYHAALAKFHSSSDEGT